jgi:hypothetical protein
MRTNTLTLIRHTLVVCLSLTTLTACATEFTGEAHFPGGARGCYDECRNMGLEMASFVMVGEYSTACACRPRGTPRSPATSSNDQAAIVAATAVVEMQRRRRAQQRQQQTHAHHMH